MPPTIDGVDGQTLLRIAAEHGVEGIVAKRTDSTYRSGTRAKSWIKTPLRTSGEGIVCGWTTTTGTPDGPVAALVLGAYTETGELVYIGRVGTGFTDSQRRALRRELDRCSRSDSPFDGRLPRGVDRDVVWARPELVAMVEYREKWDVLQQMQHSVNSKDLSGLAV